MMDAYKNRVLVFDDTDGKHRADIVARFIEPIANVFVDPQSGYRYFKCNRMSLLDHWSPPWAEWMLDQAASFIDDLEPTVLESSAVSWVPLQKRYGWSAVPQ